jgi:hypothetical protein
MNARSLVSTIANFNKEESLYFEKKIKHLQSKYYTILLSTNVTVSLGKGYYFQIVELRLYLIVTATS